MPGSILSPMITLQDSDDSYNYNQTSTSRKIRKIISCRSKPREREDVDEIELEDESRDAFRPFSLLPPEIIEQILCNLDWSESLWNRLVCSQWYAILERNVTGRVWNRYLQNSQDSLNRMGVELNEINDILDHEPSLITDRNKELLGEVKELKISCDSPQPREEGRWWTWDDYQRHTRLGEGLWNILIACRNIHVLILDLKNCNENIYESRRVSRNPLAMDNLVTFEIRTMLLRNRPWLAQIFLKRTPSLRNFGIQQIQKREYIPNKNWPPETTNLDIVYSFIARNWRTLKTLRIAIKMSSASATTWADYEIAKRKNLSKLKLLELGIGLVDTNAHLEQHLRPEQYWDPWKKLLRYQKSLEILTVETNSNELIEIVYKTVNEKYKKSRRPPNIWLNFFDTYWDPWKKLLRYQKSLEILTVETNSNELIEIVYKTVNEKYKKSRRPPNIWLNFFDTAEVRSNQFDSEILPKLKSLQALRKELYLSLNRRSTGKAIKDSLPVPSLRDLSWNAAAKDSPVPQNQRSGLKNPFKFVLRRNKKIIPNK